MLCGYLWKQEQPEGGNAVVTHPAADSGVSAEKRTAGGTNENNDENAGAMADDDPNGTNTDPDNDGYAVYRKAYCLRYVRSFFNQHLDHSWFRDKYSPACQRRCAQREIARAQREAKILANDIRQGVGNNNDSDSERFWQQRVALIGTVEAKVRGDLPVPSFHTLSTSPASLHMCDIPPHVTDDQIEAALFQLLDEAPPPPHDAVTDDPGGNGPLLQIYCGDPSTDASPRRTVPFLYREAIVVCQNEAVKERLLARLDLQQPSSSSSAAAAAAAPPLLSVPRKEGDFLPPSPKPTTSSIPHHQYHKTYALDVDCSDPYGRLEVDAGRGLAPADGHTVPLVKATLTIRPDPPRPKVHVLTAALSSPSRISGDRDAAIVLARALDAAKRLETSTLDDILETLSPNDKVLDDRVLDVAVAYLRRVHLFCFYTCSSVSGLAQLVLGKSATVHVRLVPGAPPVTPTQPLAGAAVSGTESMGGGGEGSSSSAAQVAAAATAIDVADDMLVRRQDEQIRALLEACPHWISGGTGGALTDDTDMGNNNDASGNASTSAVVTPLMTDVAGMLDGGSHRRADAVEASERDAVEPWLADHSILDDDGRARCSFHFCHKLFKDAAFLRKHLLKKHGEFLRAEQAKCHDASMMEAWERCSNRPVGDILVQCGANFGLIPTPLLLQSEPDCIDPEPALWQREEDKRKAQEEQRKRREEMRQQQQLQQMSQPPLRGAGGSAGGPIATPRAFVDVDDMKEEKVELSFDDVPLPTVAPSKKKKKRKLL